MQTGDSTVGASSGVSFAEYSRAILNILDDFTAERDRLNQTQTAVLNILEDFSAEKEMLEKTKKAVLNILDDFVAEKTRLEMTQKAVLNILEDFEEEKTKVESVNDELRREVAERRAAEGALTEKGVALARSNADLEQFAYVASHDLQEPLRMVTSYLELLSRRYREQLDDRADLYIDFAVDGAVRMRALIEALLEYARVRTQEQVVTEVHLDQVVRRVLVDLSTAIEESGGVVSVGPLPEVQGDESQLRRLLQNLVSNALKFSRGAPSVAVHAIEEDGAARIIVDDDGIGVPEAKREAVFEMFGRLHPRTEYSGTGMGLALCQTIVDAHGGRIWIEDSPTGGARVVFTLPNSSEERT